MVLLTFHGRPGVQVSLCLGTALKQLVGRGAVELAQQELHLLQALRNLIMLLLQVAPLPRIGASLQGRL